MKPACESRLEAAPLWVLPWLVLVVVAGLILRSPERINHDCALNLQCGTLLLEGKLPYVDFVDINPPLIFYLNAVPALLARVLSVNPILPFSVCVFGLVVWSTAALQAQLLSSGAITRPAAATLACLWAGFSLTLWLACDFGQREHLVVLLYIPFLVARWRRWSGGIIRRRAAILLGIAAGIGLCLKPHLALGAVLVELYFALSQRTLTALFSAEIAALVCVGLVYAIHFAFLPPVVRDSFFHFLMPLVAKGYSAYNAPPAEMVNQAIITALIVSLVGLGLFLKGPVGKLAGALAAFTFGSVAAYFLQQKGWFYHQIPALGAALLLLAVLAGQLLERLATPLRLTRWAPMRFLLPLIVGCGWLIVVEGTAKEEMEGAALGRLFLPTINAYSISEEPVLFFSTSVLPEYPVLVQNDRRPGSRYLWFFPIAMFAHNSSLGDDGQLIYRSPPDLSPEESRFVADVAEDIATRRPPLIFVPRIVGCEACPPGFNVLDYLIAVRLVDKILQDHTMIGDLLGWVVFVRNDRLAAG